MMCFYVFSNKIGFENQVIQSRQVAVASPFFALAASRVGTMLRDPAHSPEPTYLGRSWKVLSITQPFLDHVVLFGSSPDCSFAP